MGLTPAPQRRAPRKHPGDSRVGGNRRISFGCKKSGCHTIHGDSVTAKFGGQAPRLPPEKQEEHDAAAAAAAVSVAPAFGSLALGGGDDESPVL